MAPVDLAEALLAGSRALEEGDRGDDLTLPIQRAASDEGATTGAGLGVRVGRAFLKRALVTDLWQEADGASPGCEHRSSMLFDHHVRRMYLASEPQEGAETLRDAFGSAAVAGAVGGLVAAENVECPKVATDVESKGAEVCGEQTVEPLTWYEAVFTMTNCLFHIGMFSMPFAVGLAGDLVFPMLLFLTVSISIYTAKLLGIVLERVRQDGWHARPGYLDMAIAASGPRFAWFVTTICAIELFGYGITGMIMISKTMTALVPALAGAQVMVACSSITLLLAFISDNKFAYGFLLSAVAIVTICATVVLSGAMLPEYGAGARLVGAWADIPRSLALISFNTGFHPLLPIIFNNCRTTSDYNFSIKISYAVFSAIVLTFGVAAFYFFGDSTQISATLNIGHDAELSRYPPAENLLVFSSSCLVAKLLLGNLQCTRALSEYVLRLCGSDFPCSNGGVQASLAAVPVGIFFAFVGFVLQDDYQEIAALIGAVPMTLNAFVFPCVARLCIFEGLGRGERLGPLLAMAFGVLLLMSASVAQFA